MYHRLTGWSPNNEWARIWKDMTVAHFGVMSQHLSAGSEESQENTQSY